MSSTPEEKTKIEELDPKLKNIKETKHRNRISYLIIAFNAGLASLSDLATQYFFKDELKLQPARLTQIMSIVSIPWMIKPLFGLLTDLQPFFGYRRKIYIILCGILNILCWMTMSFHTNTLTEAATLLFCINCGLSFSTVLGEAIVVELSNLDKLDSDDDAKDYVSLFFFCKYLGVLSSAYLKGLLVEYLSVRTVFLITGCIPILMVISGLILKERRIRSSNEHEGERNESSLANTSFENKSLLSEFFKFLCQKTVLVPTGFIILFMSTPSFGDPYFYFMTNVLKLTPTNFGTISFFSSIMILIAIYSYKRFFKDVNFKKMIIVGSIISFILSFLAYIVVMRINTKIGISDFIICLFSSSMLSMVGEFVLMPMLALACTMCPKNLEGTVYSLFMSALNFGGIMSGLIGSFFTTTMHVTSTDFTNLHVLILISNFASLIPLPLLFCIDNSYFESKSHDEEEIEVLTRDDELNSGDQNPEKNKNKPECLNKDKDEVTESNTANSDTISAPVTIKH